MLKARRKEPFQKGVTVPSTAEKVSTGVVGRSGNMEDSRGLTSSSFSRKVAVESRRKEVTPVSLQRQSNLHKMVETKSSGQVIGLKELIPNTSCVPGTMPRSENVKTGDTWRTTLPCT